MSTQAAQALCYHDHFHVQLILLWPPDLPNIATQCRQDQKHWLSLPVMTFSPQMQECGCPAEESTQIPLVCKG